MALNEPIDEGGEASVLQIAEKVIKQDQLITSIVSAHENPKPTGLQIPKNKLEKMSQIYRKGTLTQLMTGGLSTNLTTGIPNIIKGEALQIDVYDLTKLNIGDGTAWVLHFAPGGATSPEELQKKGINPLEALVIGRRDLRKLIQAVDEQKLPKPNHVFGATTNQSMNDFLEKTGVAEMLNLDLMPFLDTRIANIKYNALASKFQPHTKNL